MTTHVSKKERHELYQDMLDEMLNDKDYIKKGCFGVGFCYFLNQLTYKYRNPFGAQIEDLPELMAKKPKVTYDEGGYWWNNDTTEGSEKRITILKKAIKKTTK